MTDLMGEIAATRAKLAKLEREAQQATCAEVGHRWKHIGGRNAACGIDGCSCSVPVHECEVCKDCDYGENPEAEKTIARCAEETP